MDYNFGEAFHYVFHFKNIFLPKLPELKIRFRQRKRRLRN